ncbi:MAG TPA: CocE/NonD family hydrolase [Candidatus Thermoplasmatota archaeon]|nr:CocE/NonD family hydrolase [Candidatus Thermoplasmatota archaeon]
MRGRALAATLLLAALVVSGCVSYGDPSGAATLAAARPCEDPWPCGDGSEWPLDLVAPQHPRQPAVLPAAMAIEGAEVVSRSATKATFAWRVPTVDAFPARIGGVASLLTLVELPVPAPDGLFLTWSLAMRVPDRDGLGGRSFDLTLLDDAGEPLCFTDHDLEILGVPTGDTHVGCASAPLAPLEAPATYTLRLRHEHDRKGDELVVELTVEVAQPFLAFERLPVERARVPMPDGIELDGAIWRPQLPDGVRAPVVLTTSPYYAQCPAQGGFTECSEDIAHEGWLGQYSLGRLLREGYAVAYFSVRGTGASGGCYDAWGALEQQDHVALVRWLAEQPWSNGRVGMTGLSYAGTTPWEAAIHQAPGLKAIVVGGIISDVYLGGFTPQGAANDGSLYFHALTTLGNSLTPPRGGDLATLPRYAPGALERACPGTERHLLAHQQGALTDARDERWFAERRLVDRFADVTAAALVLHGVEDDNFHRYQEDVVWDALPNAPKAMVLGQWDHTADLAPQLASYDGARSWYEMSKAWFDYWLKGLGRPPAMLGQVAYQDSMMRWHRDAAWPPTAAQEEVLYLADGALRAEPGGDASFRATRSPTVIGPRGGNPDLCRGGGAARTMEGTWLAYASEPLTEDVLIGGNPMAYLELASDAPGGVVSLDLYAIAPDGACAEPVTSGAADLRFHQGNMAGRDFPVGARTPVRLDLYSAATFVPAGHRLVVVLSGGGEDYKQGQANHQPQLLVGGASHLVLPLVEGSLGGRAPELAYPPRPFAPAG